MLPEEMDRTLEDRIGKLQEVAEGLLLRWTELSEELEALERAAQELDN